MKLLNLVPVLLKIGFHIAAHITHALILLHPALPYNISHQLVRQSRKFPPCYLCHDCIKRLLRSHRRAIRHELKHQVRPVEQVAFNTYLVLHLTKPKQAARMRGSKMKYVVAVAKLRGDEAHERDRQVRIQPASRRVQVAEDDAVRMDEA